MAILDADRLSAYNQALRVLGSRKLANLSENRESRRVLDDIWDNGEVVEFCLSKADWNFATRSELLEPDPGIETSFGFRYTYNKPADMVRLTTMSADEYFNRPLIASQYSDEGPYWVMDHAEIYVRYVSKDPDRGFDSSLWAAHFKKYIGAYMAYEGCERITNSTQKQAAAGRMMMDMKAHAKSRDAMDEGVKFAPSGSWVSARGGGRQVRTARGRLIG